MNLSTTDKLFQLTWTKVFGIPLAWIACVILHNVIYGLFQPFFGQGDEPFFFLLAVVVIPIYTVVCVVYSLGRLVAKTVARSQSIGDRR